MSAALIAAALLCSLPASAQGRLDHRGSVGLLIGSGADYRAEVMSGGSQLVGFRLPVDLGGTMAVGNNGNELKLVLRAEFTGPSVLGGLYGGYRGYFGADAVKTFIDVDLRADLFPSVTVGPRVGLGAQYDLHSLFGIYLGLAAHVGAGQGIRFGGEAVIGVQLRSYLLE